ncbi:MAG: LLM class F420-dependent oxidoreductase [Gammaproteobacteria bacterium]|nr:LLM class F420-dependent oxidoreductase [Gammaproteobacteria bacterium]
MKIGIFSILPNLAADPAVVAKHAEALGFDSYWVPDHTILPVTYSDQYPGVRPGAPGPDYLWQMPDPLIALTRAATATSTILLGTGIILVPERNPLLAAKMVASLDAFSGGRFLMGIGAGWNREECEILGGDFDHRWGQTKDYILAMKQLWTQAESEYHGKYVDFPPVRCFPKPAQRPHPPILLGGFTAERVYQRIAEWGDGWLPVLESVDQFRQGVERLKRAADAVGRDYGELTKTVFGIKGQWEVPEEIRALEAAGADRLVMWLPENLPLNKLLAEMEAMARRLL